MSFKYDMFYSFYNDLCKVYSYDEILDICCLPAPFLLERVFYAIMGVKFNDCKTS